MNICNLLGPNNPQTTFPKLKESRGGSRFPAAKHSTEKIISKSQQKTGMKFRATYQEILQIPHTTKRIFDQNERVDYNKQVSFETKNTTHAMPKKYQSIVSPVFKLNGYDVVREIGKGGFAEVQEVVDEEGNRLAIKQYVLINSYQCFKNQCIVGEHFFEKGRLRPRFAQKRGGSNLISFFEKFKTGKKGHIVQELGGKSLSKTISEIQGVFHKNQRVYEIRLTSFYNQLVFQKKLKDLLIQIAEGIKLLNEQGYIHCDLKPENILVNQKTNEEYCYKIIDFGSAFRLEQGLPKITITPEYMPPELLEELSSSMMLQAQQNPCTTVKELVKKLSKIDIWSLGCILLEIVTGMPLWFRYKCKLTLHDINKEFVQLGIFALTNRQYHKILKKQKELCSNLRKIGFTYGELQGFRGLLIRMLTFDYHQRASIDQVLAYLYNMP